MAQNRQMGVGMMPPPASPANPTAVNFQSDPNMRQQFKGFMSGLSKKMEQQQPMMQAPLQMPMPMQNVDIFQPMPMAMGGPVPRSTNIAGQPHMLSYITPGEANVLQSMGGSGAPGPGGIPSFFFDFDEGDVTGQGRDVDYSPSGGSTNFSSGSQSFDVATSSDEPDGVTFTSGPGYTPGDGVQISSSTLAPRSAGDTYNRQNTSIYALDPFGGAGANIDDIRSGRTNAMGQSLGASQFSPRPFAQVNRSPIFTSGVTGTPEFGIPSVDALSGALTQAQIDRYDSMPAISQQAGQAQVQLGRDMRMPDGTILSTDPVAGPLAESLYDYDVDLLGLNMDPQREMGLLQDAARGQDYTNRFGSAIVPEGFGSSRPSVPQTPMVADFARLNPATIEQINRENLARSITNRGGQIVQDELGNIIEQNPVTGEAVSSVPSPIAMPDAIREQRADLQARQQASSDVQDMQNPFNRGESAGERVAQGQPSGAPEFDRNTPEFGVPEFDRDTPEFGVSPGSSLPDTVFDAGAFTPTEVQAAIDAARTKGGDTTTVEAGRGLGARQVFDTLGAKAPEDQSFLGALYDTITGRQYPTEEEINQGVIDAQNRRTTATLGFQDPRFGGVAPPVNTPGAVTRSALSQLESRANRQGSGILGAFTNFGARNARNMFDDIVTKGYEPVYDSRGQIVATRVPGTNILGRGSVESRIPGMAGSSDGGGPQLPPVVAQTAEEDAGEETPPIIKLPPIAGPPGIDLPILPEPVKPAEVGNPLGFGYGQYTPANSNLESSVDKFIKMLGG